MGGPPGPLEIEHELAPAVGDEDIASLQRNGFASTDNPSLAFKVDTGPINVIRGACDVRPGMSCLHTLSGDLRDAEVSDDSRLDLACTAWLPAGSIRTGVT